MSGVLVGPHTRCLCPAGHRWALPASVHLGIPAGAFAAAYVQDLKHFADRVSLSGMHAQRRHLRPSGVRSCTNQGPAHPHHKCLYALPGVKAVLVVYPKVTRYCVGHPDLVAYAAAAAVYNIAAVAAQNSGSTRVRCPTTQYIFKQRDFSL